MQHANDAALSSGVYWVGVSGIGFCACRQEYTGEECFSVIPKSIRFGKDIIYRF